ncbi:MAG: class I SAM-dependent methyltransferase [Sphingomonas sp.]
MNAVLPEPESPAQRSRAAGRTIGSLLLSLTAPLGHRILDRIDQGLAVGELRVTLPGGAERLLGGRAPGPRVEVDLASWRALLRLASGGSVGWYVAWSKGEWSSPNPVALFEIFSRNRRTLGNTGRAHGLGWALRRLWHIANRNSRIGARRNIHRHYDLGNDFYAAWLDPTLAYSSALFDQPMRSDEPLEAAQHRKLTAMLERTATEPGDHILEIGCGWGSFARIASAAGRRVHGITISEEQVQALTKASLPGVEVTLTDYRDVAGHYDAVVSIEMVEAVGQAYWRDYLAAIARALKPGGRAAVQYIAIDDAIFEAYAQNVDFIQAYVFPGGMLLSESRFRALAEEIGLAWTDRVAFPADYAETLKRWRANFDAAIADNRLPRRFDREFQAFWRYYLMYCEGGFRGGGIEVAQVTLVKPLPPSRSS